MNNPIALRVPNAAPDVQQAFKDIEQAFNQSVRAQVKSSGSSSLTAVLAQIQSLQTQLNALTLTVNALVSGYTTVKYKVLGSVAPYSVAYESGSMQISQASNDDANTVQSVVGVTGSTGGVTGSVIDVFEDGSTVTSPFWSWTPQAPVFLGTAGVLTQTPPAAGSMVCVGTAVTAQSILVKIGKPVSITGGDLTRVLTLTQAGDYATSDVTPFYAVAAVNLLPGQPVYTNPTTKQLALLDCLTLPTATCCGLVQSSTLATFAAPVQNRTFTLADWTAITGSILLSVGSCYFASDTPGILSTTPPVTIGKFNSVVGIASTLTTLNLMLLPPAQL